MYEEATEKRINRRTRSERTKRRQRYLYSNCDNNCETNKQLLTYDLTPSSAEYSYENNNCMRCKQKGLKMGNKKMSIAKQSISKPRDHLYKILVIGDLGTGKTSIIKRYVHRFFTQNYRATIGVDFALKVINWDENTLIRLQLWDIAGQERYGNMTRVYYKEAVGAFIVFDVTRKNTYDSVANWKSDLDSKVQLPDGSSIPCVLLANKCDQPKDNEVALRIPQMDEYCSKNGFTAWFETSARDNLNIDEAAKALVEKILYYDTVINDKKEADGIVLSKQSNEEEKRKCYC